jgi:DNA helicase-2/ATP-dependent DNA helicase PcrA
LVKALSHVVRSRGPALEARSQRIACITYTEVAAREIHEEIGNDPLAAVSTIHSFLWSIIKSFQVDIGLWVATEIEEGIADLLEVQAGFSSRTRPATLEKNELDLARRRRQKDEVPHVTRWTYGVTSNYASGVLGHSDVLKMVPQLILTRELLARIVALRFPFIFVDESQDTFPEVVECLNRIHMAAQGRMCLGYFGDPMQQIYQQGAGDIGVAPDWVRVEKPENFRSSRSVLACVNAVRVDGDSLTQVTGLAANQSVGAVRFFVLPADGNRSAYLEGVRTWLDAQGEVGEWTSSVRAGGAKILVIAHRMAAIRLGFEGLFTAFANKATPGLNDAFRDGSAWPLLPFSEVLLPLCAASGTSDPGSLALLRRHSPLFQDARGGKAVQDALMASRLAVVEMAALFASGEASLGEVLRLASTKRIVELDPRLHGFLFPEAASSFEALDQGTVEVLSASMACAVGELRGYLSYIRQESPYSTQHGTKGAEFDRVIVVLDDEEGRFNLYSYEKLFGIKELSATDAQNLAEGKDSAVDRTRRLFYVCVSRARESLAIVLFAKDPEGALSAVKASRVGACAQVLSLGDVVA